MINLLDLVFYKKLSGSGRCPRGEALSGFDVAAFLAANPMGGTIKVKSAAE